MRSEKIKVMKFKFTKENERSFFLCDVVLKFSRILLPSSSLLALSTQES